MRQWILIGILALAVAGTGFWGYQEHQKKENLAIQVENNYQKSFHNLSYHLDMLHDQIGEALAVNSKGKLSAQMTDMWALTSKAMSNVGQLPLSFMPFDKTKTFLSKINDFTYQTSVRDLDEEPFDDKEIKTLQKLHDQSEELKKELRQVQHKVLDKNLRWKDVELALSNQQEENSNTIIDGFQTVEEKVDGYSKEHKDSSLSKVAEENSGYQNLSGKDIDKKQALKIGKKFFKADSSNQLTAAESGDGSDVAIYSVSYENDDTNGHLDISKQGGYPLSLIINRNINEQNISINKGLKQAKDYLKKYNFDDMEVTDSNQFDNIGVYTFTHKQKDVRIYPEHVKLKVALDNGDLLGISARDYFKNYKEKRTLKPELTKKEAKDKINSNVTINETNKAIISNNDGKNKLVYEFLGELNGRTYRICINAMNGTEEKVKKLDGTEMNYAFDS